MGQFEKGQRANPLGRGANKGKSPEAKYVDEPEAPQMLRDMRWVYCTGKNAACPTAGQKAVKMLLESDAPRFLATLERLEGEWAEEKRRRSQESSTLPGDSDPDSPVQLDEVSARVVDSIDRWLADLRRRAEAPHSR